MFGKKTDSKNGKGALMVKLGFLVFGFMALLITAGASKSFAVSSDISKVYKTDQTIKPGQVVALSGEKGDYVILANQDDKHRVLGVAVAPNDSGVVVDSNVSGVNVALSGRAEVLIKSDSRDVQRGELIGISPEDGIGGTARSGHQTIGVAEASSKDIESENGYKKLPIIVTPGVAETPLAKNSIVAKIAGKNISAVQAFLAIAIAVCGIITIGFLSYSSIKHSLSAVGRNPLAKPAILGAMSQVMFMVALVATVSVGLMYVTLRM